MKTKIKELIAKELEYIDNMPFGTSTTTNRIMIELGYKNLDFEDLMDIEYGVYNVIEESRDYILDKSHHDDMVEGLPFNLDFIKNNKV